MSATMINSAPINSILSFRDRSEKLQRIQTLSTEIEKNERGIVDKERKIIVIDKKIEKAEKIITAHEQVIKDTEALISNNEALISNNEKIIKTTEELLSCYKSLLANNKSKKDSSTVNDDTPPTKEERVISTTAYQKAKQDLVDLNLDLKNNKQLTKIVEKKSVISTDQSVDDSKTRMTAYSILNDCFNNFRLKYLSSMRWF